MTILSNESENKVGNIVTDSSMLCIWDYESFSNITDYGIWEQNLLEDDDILKHLKKGHLVPIWSGSDVAAKAVIRWGSKEDMSEREKEYNLVPSHPYYLKSNGKLCVSGVEHISKDISSNTICLEVEPGEYSVQLNMIDWAEEPGAFVDGKPTENALPDYIIYLNKPTPDITFRQELLPYRKEDALR